MPKVIGLTQGFECVVDDSDFELVSKHRWKILRAGKKIYAARTNGPKTILMHRVILPGCSIVDHKDGNGLNNQRENLRPANKQLNAANSILFRSGKTSQFKGVYWNKNDRRWQAQIGNNGKRERQYLGQFKSETEAALAYDREATLRFGEFAVLNFPIKGPSYSPANISPIIESQKSK